jgi:hypothetical protein
MDGLKAIRNHQNPGIIQTPKLDTIITLHCQQIMNPDFNPTIFGISPLNPIKSHFFWRNHMKPSVFVDGEFPKKSPASLASTSHPGIGLPPAAPLQKSLRYEALLS